MVMETNYLDELVNIYRHDCFKDIKDKKIYVWGAGKWADKFMAFYREELNIVAVVDSNKEKKGIYFYDIPVSTPELFYSLDMKSDYKVIICIKDCKEVLEWLFHHGIHNIGIYDANYIYPGRQNVMVIPDRITAKKYHVGYISGVFDLYHIGHINMFRRAKEQCDYLIAAVTSDEYVRNRKKREPFIPERERLEVVRSCKYVDEAFITPYKYGGIVEAYEKYHYDVQFCGSDYKDNPWWLEQKAWLEAHGAHLEFLSYTEQTSSTKIKELIEKGLL